MRAVFCLGIMVNNANVSFTFQAVKNLSGHPHIYGLGCFVDFW